MLDLQALAREVDAAMKKRIGIGAPFSEPVLGETKDGRARRAPGCAPATAC